MNKDLPEFTHDTSQGNTASFPFWATTTDTSVENEEDSYQRAVRYVNEILAAYSHITAVCIDIDKNYYKSSGFLLNLERAFKSDGYKLESDSENFRVTVTPNFNS